MFHPAHNSEAENVHLLVLSGEGYRVLITEQLTIPAAQLSLPYMPPTDSPILQAGNRRHKSPLKALPNPGAKPRPAEPDEYEALRSALTGLVFTRAQAVELVGQILDNVR